MFQKRTIFAELRINLCAVICFLFQSEKSFVFKIVWINGEVDLL